MNKTQKPETDDVGRLRLSVGLGNWIAVEDQYPPRFVPSIVATKNMVVNVLLAWNGEFWTFGFTDERYEFPVTHWMPLPQMPNDPIKRTAQRQD